MIPRKYRPVSDFIAEVMDDMAQGFNYLDPKTTNFTFNGQWVDTDKYEIRPKKEYYETLITRKQEQIDTLIRQHESDEKYYERRLQELREEKEKLLRDRDNK